MRDGMDVVLTVIDDKESSDEESSGYKSSSASPSSTGLPSSCVSSNISTAFPPYVDKHMYAG
eukprot:6482959-Ditylum_brightwellii.AAC.1